MSSISGSVDFAGAPVAHLASTPSQPIHDPQAGSVLAIDGRIDGVRICGTQIDGAKEVLRAYQAWGESCPVHILGDFAFAIWDHTQQRLFVARDTGGVRPLFFAVLPDGSFRFATNAPQILDHSDVPRTIDQAGLVDFLISRSALLSGRTPWNSVQRLQPGQALTFDRAGLHVSRYWSVHETPAERFAKPADAVAACSAALQAAIRDRVQGPRRAGISLSGGWDSGAVFAIWQWMRAGDPSLAEPWFYTYYGDSAEADERAAVGDLLRCWPASGEFVHLDASCGLDGLEQHCAQLGMPEPASGWRWVAQCAAAARNAGVSSMLAGEAGNEVFQSSILRPADLLRSGRIREAYRQAQAWGRDAETSIQSFLWPFVLRQALAAAFPAIRGAARSKRPAHFAYLTDSSRELAMDMMSQANARNQSHRAGRTMASWDKRVALERWCADLFPMPVGPELEGVALSTPFLDRRVVTTALAALDSECAAGSTRQLLASTVEFTTGQPFHGRHAHYTELLDKMLRRASEKGDSLFRASTLVELGVVDPNRLKILVDGFRAAKAPPLGILWRLVSAEAWARCV
jgi:asparagine synthetase B (glutamine-hydrolysing)